MHEKHAGQVCSADAFVQTAILRFCEPNRSSTKKFILADVPEQSDVEPELPDLAASGLCVTPPEISQTLFSKVLKFVTEL